MRYFTTLKQQHLAILAIAGRLLTLLQHPGPEQVDAVGNCRVELSRAIHQNLLSEEAILIAPLRRENLTGQLPMFASIASDAAALRAHYSRHVSDWNLRAIQNDWAGYATAVGALVSALHDLVQRKERDLWPAAERLLTRQAQQFANSAGPGLRG